MSLQAEAIVSYIEEKIASEVNAKTELMFNKFGTRMAELEMKLTEHVSGVKTTLLLSMIPLFIPLYLALFYTLFQVLNLIHK